MRDISIVPSLPEHVRVLGKNLRRDDAREAEGLGLIPHRALWRSFRNSVYVRTGLIDGEVAAMWGVGGRPLGVTGVPWLLTAPAVEAIPVQFLKIARQELENIKALFPRLENYVLADYRGAIRLLEALGFALEPPCRVEKTGAWYRRFHLEFADVR